MSRLWAARMFMSLVAMVKATFLPVWELTACAAIKELAYTDLPGLYGIERQCALSETAESMPLYDAPLGGEKSQRNVGSPLRRTGMSAILVMARPVWRVSGARCEQAAGEPGGILHCAAGNPVRKGVRG